MSIERHDNDHGWYLTRDLWGIITSYRDYTEHHIIPQPEEYFSNYKCARNDTDETLTKFKRVRILHINNNKHITDAALTRLTTLTTLYCGEHNLMRIHLFKNRITDAGIVGLVNLKDLRCFGNILITDASVVRLTNLTHLYCIQTGITDVGIAGLINLQVLYCSGSDISDAGVKNLINLTSLHPVNTRITIAGISHLPKINQTNVAVYLDP